MVRRSLNKNKRKSAKRSRSMKRSRSAKRSRSMKRSRTIGKLRGVSRRAKRTANNRKRRRGQKGGLINVLNKALGQDRAHFSPAGYEHLIEFVYDSIKRN